jgi:hypothetical protein
VPVSTDSTLSELIVGGIRGIAQSELGFDEPGGNVRDYRYEDEAEERRGPYLMAKVGGRQRVRCWSVWVQSSDRFYATGSVMLRTYSVTIDAFYPKLKGGEGAKAIRDGALKIRGAIRGFGSMLHRLVDTCGPIGEVAIAEMGGVEAPDGQILRGRFGFTAEKRNPDF